MVTEKTITSIFILPTLHFPKESLKGNGFINAYSKDLQSDFQYEDCIYLLLLPEDLPKFREFLDNEYERTDQIVEDYDYDGGYVVLVYKLDLKWKDDFNLVKQGKYSKTSKDYQNEFSKIIKIRKKGLHRDEISLQYRVFNKTDDMVDYWEKKLGIRWSSNLEVWTGYDEEKEILNINNLKTLVK